MKKPRWSSGRFCLDALLSTVLAMTISRVSAADEVRPRDLPEGEGAAIVARKCNACHTLDRVLKQRRTETEWQTLVKFMIVQGLDISEDDQRIVIRYLTNNFGSDRGGTEPHDSVGPSK